MVFPLLHVTVQTAISDNCVRSLLIFYASILRVGGEVVCAMHCSITYKMLGIPNTFISSLFQKCTNNAVFNHAFGIVNNNV